MSPGQALPDRPALSQDPVTESRQQAGMDCLGDTGHASARREPVMRPMGWMAIIAAGWAVQVQAASVTVGTLFDTDEGSAWRAGGTIAPGGNWLLGAGAGRHAVEFNGESYSGTSLAASARVTFGNYFAGAGGQRWKDSGDLESLALHAELGWMNQDGFALSALFTDRSLRAPFTTTGLGGQSLSHQSRSDGQGFGAAVAWTG